MEPLLVVKVAVPVPVAVFTLWVGCSTVKPLGQGSSSARCGITDTSLTPGVAPAAMEIVSRYLRSRYSQLMLADE